MLLDVPEKSPPAMVPQVRRLSVARAVCSFPVILAALLVVLTVLTVRGRFSDPDMWWHLKTGEIIWNTHHIPTVDSFSFTTNNHAYVPHEWLSQLALYGAYHFGGYTGLMLSFCLLASLLVVAGYTLCALYSGNLKVAFLGGLITWLFATIGLSIRPQIIGYLFLVCELLVIYLGRSRNSRWFFALPPMFAIWVNCHGSFFLGLIVLGATLACVFVELEWGLLTSHRWKRDQRNTLSIAFVLSIAALFLNPIGLRQVTYPMETLLNQTQQMKAVAEWQPPHFDDIRGVALLAVAGLILLVPLLRRSQLRLQELLFLAFGFGLAIQHERMLFVFGILAAPILCRLLADCWDRYEPDRDRPFVNAVVAAILLCVVVGFFPDRQQLASQVEQGNPVKAVDFINRSGLSGNMLNQYVYGGYLIWAAPRHKVFVDGRGDVFEWTGVLEEYGKWVTLQTDPNILLNKYQIHFCLLSADAPMSHVLQLLPGWTKIYSDEMAVIWAKSEGYR
jgi:hypothetical protein